MELLPRPEAIIPGLVGQTAQPSPRAKKRQVAQFISAPSITLPPIEYTEEGEAIKKPEVLNDQQKYFRQVYNNALDDSFKFNAMMKKKYGEERKGYSQIIPDSSERGLQEELRQRTLNIRKIACREGFRDNLLPPELCYGLPSRSEQLFPKITMGAKRFKTGAAPSFHLA